MRPPQDWKAIYYVAFGGERQLGDEGTVHTIEYIPKSKVIPQAFSIDIVADYLSLVCRAGLRTDSFWGLKTKPIEIISSTRILSMSPSRTRYKALDQKSKQ